MSFNWTFDPATQTLRAPSGLSITVREIAQMLADHRDRQYNFAGDWAGWKMRRHFLIPPFIGRHGPKLTPQNAKLFLRWVHEPSEKTEPRRLAEGPQLQLVYPRFH
jgi:hypothetical protein